MLGAFGAHGLKKRIADPARLTNWGTAAQYQLVHSAVLTFASVVAPQNTIAMGLFTAGELIHVLKDTMAGDQVLCKFTLVL